MCGNLALMNLMLIIFNKNSILKYFNNDYLYMNHRFLFVYLVHPTAFFSSNASICIPYFLAEAIFDFIVRFTSTGIQFYSL